MNDRGFLVSLGFFGVMLGKIGDFWKKQEQSRKRLLVVLGAAGLLLAAALVWLLNLTSYAVLYTNMSANEAGEIMQQLAEMKIDAQARGSDTILVPAEKVDAIRMELAAAGFPKSSTSLDILQKGSGFGITEEDKAIYRRYQLQDDLQKAIKTFASVADARVSLNIPQDSAFLIDDQKTAATAAVLLTLRPGTALTAGNIAAISKLVEKSVPGLQPDGVSIIDNNMNVLNAESNSAEFLTADQQVMEQQVGDRLKKQVLALLQPVFGVDKVLAEVSVTLDFNDSIVDSIKFEPASGSTGIIASIDKIRETANKAVTSSAGGTAGTDANGGAAAIYPVVGVGDSIYEKNSEKINYEINTIKEHLVKAKGSISHLSVSVVLDAQDEDPADYSENVRKLIATAVGVPEDLITVEKLPFKGVATQTDTWASYQETNARALQWQRTRFFIQLGAGLLLAMLVLIFLTRIIRGPRRSKEDELDALMPSLRATRPNLATAFMTAAPAGSEAAGELDQQRQGISSLNDAHAIEKQTVASYFESNPELAATILRSWLAEEQG